MNNLQREKYNRHIILPEIGESGQKKLRDAKVLVVGAGGLGSPVLMYLAAAGIGTLGIVDDDVVSLSNLQRQVLYNETQLNEFKVEKAKDFLLKLNSDTTVETYRCLLDHLNAETIIPKYDIVIGATDNFESRRIIDQYCKRCNIPFVHGSIAAFEGQVSVFNYKGGPSYSDLFPETPDEEDLPLGVMGVLPGIIGSIQAAEAVKIITGTGSVLSGILLIYNAAEAEFSKIEFA